MKKPSSRTIASALIAIMAICAIVVWSEVYFAYISNQPEGINLSDFITKTITSAMQLLTLGVFAAIVSMVLAPEAWSAALNAGSAACFLTLAIATLVVVLIARFRNSGK